MSLRKLYALAGAAWGLVLGAVAGVGTVGYALGFSWLFLFGDSTWPAAAGPVIIGFGIVVFLFFFVSLTAFGYVYGQRLEHAMPGSDPGATGRHRRRAFLLMASAGVAALLLVGAGAARELADTRAREARAAEEASFDDLVGRRYSIGPIEVILTGAADTLVARFEAAGDRDGEYQLRWRVNEPTYDSLLVTGDATFLLCSRAGAACSSSRLSISQSFYSRSSRPRKKPSCQSVSFTTCRSAILPCWSRPRLIFPCDLRFVSQRMIQEAE